MKKKFEATHNPIAEAPVDPPREQPTDAELAESVRASIAADGRLAGERFEVAVENGCVILTGSISREYLRVLVDAQVKSVPGVLVVKDQLSVRQEGPMADPED